VLAQKPWLYAYLNEECRSDRELCKVVLIAVENSDACNEEEHKEEGELDEDYIF